MIKHFAWKKVTVIFEIPPQNGMNGFSFSVEGKTLIDCVDWFEGIFYCQKNVFVQYDVVL